MKRKRNFLILRVALISLLIIFNQIHTVLDLPFIDFKSIAVSELALRIAIEF